MAARGPTGSLRQTSRVVGIANKNSAGGRLLLEMAFQTKRRVSLGQQPLIHRAVRGMAADATFSNSFMFENERPALRRVTLQAGVVVTEEGSAATLHALRQIRPAAFDRIALVRVMAISAADLALEHRMMMRQHERRAHFGVALEAGRRRFPWIDDRHVAATAGLHVQAAGAMARFAAHILGVGSLRLQARVCRGPEISRDRLMAGRALFGADKFGARNTGRRHDRAARFEVAAGKQNERERGPSTDQPPELFALTDEPSSEPRMQHDRQSDRLPVRLATHFYRHNPYPPLGIMPTHRRRF